MLDEQISGLIGRIYRSAGDRPAWDAVMEEIRARTNSRYIFATAADLRHAIFLEPHFHGVDSARFLDGAEDYKARLFADDPALRFAVNNPTRGAISLSAASRIAGGDRTCGEFIAWNQDVLGTGDYYVRYSSPDEGLSLGLTIAPSRERGGHEARELALFDMLFHHVESALQIAARLPDLGNIIEAVALLDRKGAVRVTSPAAEAVFARADGLRLRNRAIEATRRSDTLAIERLIASALKATTDGSVGGVCRVSRPSGLRPWIVRVSPLPGRTAPLAPFRLAVAVTIIDLSATTGPVASERWRMAFGLTPAESRLVDALLGSESGLREAADMVAMSYATARVHLLHVFEKTGARTQMDLTRMLLRIG